MKKNPLIAIAAAAAVSQGNVYAQQQPSAQSQGQAASSGSSGTPRTAAPSEQTSSVRIGGMVDVGVRRDSGAAQGSTWSVSPGLRSVSRLNFSVVEDLGSGLTAAAQLEMGFNADTGAGTNNPPGVTSGFSFGRNAAVGVGSKDWGFVSLGRQYAPIHAVAASFWNDPFGANALGGINTLYSKTAFVSNTIAYTYGYGPSMTNQPAPRRGLGFALFHALGEESAPLSNAGNQYGANVSYGTEQWWAAYGWHRQIGNSVSTNAVASSEMPRVTYQYIGGMWDFKSMLLSLGYNTGKNDLGTLERRNWHVGVTAMISDRSSIRFIHGRANDRTAANADFKTTQVLYQYDLSKRTAVYAVWGNLDNNENSAASLANFTGTITRGSTISSVGGGLRHIF